MERLIHKTSELSTDGIYDIILAYVITCRIRHKRQLANDGLIGRGVPIKARINRLLNRHSINELYPLEKCPEGYILYIVQV